MITKQLLGSFAALATLASMANSEGAAIVHDAEYYILEAQNGKVWAVEDGELDTKLAALREKYGKPPNIVHYMWDDQPPMAFGNPMYQQMRGYSTPVLNQLAEGGLNSP